MGECGVGSYAPDDCFDKGYAKYARCGQAASARGPRASGAREIVRDAGGWMIDVAVQHYTAVQYND